ncbi:MAG: hypothetical protein WAU75_18725 [Solirubrobacteraceae bacterium]|jgi:hypothetical protein
MSSRGKKKTTMAKLNREARLRERRSEKAARKEARRDAAANPSDGEDMTLTESDETPDPMGERESVGPARSVSMAGPPQAR